MTSNWNHVFVPTIMWIQLSIDLQVFVSSCQVYPSEYAYHKDSVERNEPDSAKCRMYLANEFSVQNYIHCNGTQLRLTDSDLGNKQYTASDHYVWPTGTRTEWLLFIFSSRVTFSTITLHYFRNINRGLPRLRFFAVPDDFYIWNAPSIVFKYIEIAKQHGEPAGQRNINILFNLTTAKILMNKLGNHPQLAVSEVEFFTFTNVTSNCPVLTSTPMANTHTTSLTIHKHTIASAESTSASTLHHRATITTLPPDSGTESSQQSGHNFVVQLSVGVITVLLILAVAILTLIVLLLLWNNKRIHKLMTESGTDEDDASYSTLNRATKQQTQPQSLNTPAELYSQIQLSPSTGQAEPTTNSESYIFNHMQKPTVTKTNSDLLQGENNTLDSPTYAVVNKNRGKINISQGNTLHEAVHTERLTVTEPATTESPIDQLSHKQEDMYAVVHKKPKKCEEQKNAPPIPSHTIESLYTAVQKKPK